LDRASQSPTPAGLELELLERVRETLRPPPLGELIRLLESGKYLSGRKGEHSFRANDSVRVVRLGHRQLLYESLREGLLAAARILCRLLGRLAGHGVHSRTAVTSDKSGAVNVLCAASIIWKNPILIESLHDLLRRQALLHTGERKHLIKLEDLKRPNTRQDAISMRLSADGKMLAAFSYYYPKKGGGPDPHETLITGWDPITRKQFNKTLRMPPALKAHIMDHVWSLEEVIYRVGGRSGELACRTAVIR
jgi:hypothetical protein